MNVMCIFAAAVTLGCAQRPPEATVGVFPINNGLRCSRTYTTIGPAFPGGLITVMGHTPDSDGPRKPVGPVIVVPEAQFPDWRCDDTGHWLYTIALRMPSTGAI
jgi:hypothetical protein